MHGKKVIDTVEKNSDMYGIVATNVLTLHGATRNAFPVFIEQ